jgi:hypothetical protein
MIKGWLLCSLTFSIPVILARPLRSEKKIGSTLGVYVGIQVPDNRAWIPAYAGMTETKILIRHGDFL